jgi:hypothetical protein
MTIFKKKIYQLLSQEASAAILLFVTLICSALETPEAFFLICLVGGVESKLGPLGMSATSGLLYLPRVIVRMENLVE